MALAPGTRLGPYEVAAQIGVGGMGEVYRATDTNLKRAVAIKVLPASVAGDAEQLARFQREAEVLASLNHPNIAAIYGLERSDGTTALVMELVEGPTLADRAAKGSIPVDEALPIAKQIAEALDAAHERGIIHRDLKPANIKIRPDGTVKVLDFGLAKAMEPASGALPTLSMSPTITTPAMTQMGVILGTAAFMSPEQARGKRLDKRTDIWAFGCVLFEMLSGKRAFDGEDVAETLGAIIHKEPAWTILPANTPSVVLKLLQRCLEKDPKQRLRDIGDGRLEIDSALRAPVALETMAGRSPASRSRSALAGWLVAVTLGLLASGLGFLHFSERPPEPAPAVRFEIRAPEKTTLVTGGTISPDGRLVAFGARNDLGIVTIWVRSLDSLEARPLTGTEGTTGQTLFWSPDSRFVVYVAADRTLKKIAASGGPSQTLADLEGPFQGGDWNRDGIVIFALSGRGVRQVPADGGTPSAVTNVESPRESSHVEPMFLPDGRHFLYTRIANEREDSGVYVGTLEAGGEPADSQRLLRGVVRAVFAPSSSDRNVGHLVFVRGGTLMSQPFDAARIQVGGEAMPLVENMSDLGARTFSASTDGVLAFRSAGATAGSRLIWFDRQGKSLGEVGPPALYGDLALTPDGKNLVVSQRESQTGTAHLWVVDLQRQVPSRLNPGGQRDTAPAVSHDSRIVFSSGIAGDLYTRSASGAGDAELLLKSANVKHPADWSADGRFIIYDEHHPTQRQDLWMLPLTGNRKPVPILTTAADEWYARFSPDDRWIVYVSDESGRREVYVRDFAPDRVPAVGSERFTISTAGGDKPHWRRDGKEIYYIAPSGKMMAVPAKLESTFEPGVAVPLFDTNVAGTYSYGVTADGRFLMNTIAEEDSSTPITIVMNWQATPKK